MVKIQEGYNDVKDMAELSPPSLFFEKFEIFLVDDRAPSFKLIKNVSLLERSGSEDTNNASSSAGTPSTKRPTLMDP